MLVRSSSMAVRCCWILAGTGTRCRIQSIPNMLNGWHVQWVCFQELCTNPCNMGPCIIMLQHEVMVMDEWHNNGPQDLVTVSLCIQNTINKMHLCSLSITYTCPYHNPTATMGHSIHNVDISKPLTAHPHDAIHAVCHLPCTVKTGIHPWREHLSKVPDSIESEHLPTQVGYDDKLQSGRAPDEDDEHADKLPWASFWQFGQKFFGYANWLLQQLSGWQMYTIQYVCV